MRAGLALFAVLLLWPVALRAAEVDEGRRRFDAGSTALTTGRFAEARDHFRAALAIANKAPVAFNLAVALRGTGEAIESVQIFEALLAGDYGTLSNERRREAEALLAETRADIATLELVVRGAPSADVQIDGRRVGNVVEGSPSRHRVDPGTHVLSAVAPERQRAEKRIDLPRGGSSVVDLELIPTPEATQARLIVDGESKDIVRIVGVAEGTVPLERVLAPGRYRVEADGPSGLRTSEIDLVAGQTLRVRLEAEPTSVFESPWLWGGAAVVIAGATIVGIVLFGNRTADPVSDPTYGVVSAVHRFQ